MPHTRTSDQREQGFTLIELLVVIIIIGVLAAIAIPVFLNQRKKGTDASLKSDLRNLAQAEETWIVDNASAIGTADPVALKAAGFTHGTNASVLVTLNPTNQGYCLIARATNDQDTGGGYPYFIEYDSVRGGILNSGKFRDINTPNPGGGACGVNRTGFTALP